MVIRVGGFGNCYEGRAEGGFANYYVRGVWKLLRREEEFRNGNEWEKDLEMIEMRKGFGIDYEGRGFENDWEGVKNYYEGEGAGKIDKNG